MKNKYCYPFFLFAILATNSCAQNKPLKLVQNVQNKIDTNFTFIKKIEGNFSYLDVDVLGNMYVITIGNQLKKLNTNGDSSGIFNDVKQYGQPSLIDVSNPLKVLVYYNRFSTVVILDRFLTLRSSINFRNKNIFKVKSIANAYDNNIWIFDEQDYKLKKINDAGEVITETNDFRQIFDKAPSPTEMHDTEGYIYLYDPAEGFFIFDYYGSLKNNYPFLNWEHIAVTKNYLYGFQNKMLHTYTLNTFTTNSYSLKNIAENYKTIKAINGKLYILKENAVEIYEINIKAK